MGKSGAMDQKASRHDTAPKTSWVQKTCWGQSIFPLKETDDYLLMNELREISENIWSSLGPGYSESVYHCAFEVALRERKTPYETERIVPVYYQGQNVGHIRADLIIDRRIVVELKAVSKLNETYRIQTRNYLRLLGLEEGYLINFPDKLAPLEFERIELDLDPVPASATDTGLEGAPLEIIPSE